VLVRRLLPDDESRIDEEMVWFRLVASCASGPSNGDIAMASYFADREIHVRTLIERVLTLLEVGEREAETVRLRALVDGQTVAVCLGRISPGEGVLTMDRHVAELRERPVRVAG
jgi:hypothetical protein